MASSYPGSIDGFSTKVDDITTVAAADVNDLQDAMVATQGELGLDPAGSEATVRARLDKIFEIQIYTGDDTWTKPAGLIKVIVEVIAGGGGGGGSNSADLRVGGGGGGGGYSIEEILAASLGSTETVTVGAAGAAGTSTGTGGTGGTSSFGALLSATGGSGGAAGNNSSGPAAAGVGSGGDIDMTGEAGTYDLVTIATQTYGGRGGASPRGWGQPGHSNGENTVGLSGEFFGGGGGGGYRGTVTSRAGGAGGQGGVIVYEYF